MDKGKVAIVLFVGAFLLYTGIRGSEGFTHPIPGLTMQTYGFTDNFETSTLDSTHWAGSLETNLQGTGAIIQGNSQTVISGGSQNSGGYYVTKDSYVGASATISVKVTADNQAAPTLMVSSSPFTMSAPLDCKIPWYLMVFVSETQVGAPPRNNYFLYVEHCGGGGTTDVQILYSDLTFTNPPTGTLQIQVTSGSVRFSVDGVVKYTESWSLPSTNIYAGFGNFSPTDLSGSATFKTFTLNTGTAPPPTYSDVTISYAGTGTGTCTPAPRTDDRTTWHVGDPITFTITSGNFDHLTASTGTVNGLTVSNIGTTENIVVYFTQGTSTKGTLRVWASYNGADVSASITVTPGDLTGTTPSDGTALSWQVNSGLSYHVAGTYNLGTSPQTADVWVYQGQNTDVYLNFGGSSVTPPPDFLAILDNATVRTFMVIIGVFMTGISTILLATPSKRITSPPTQ